MGIYRRRKQCQSEPSTFTQMWLPETGKDWFDSIPRCLDANRMAPNAICPPGAWLDSVTSLRNAHLTGIHLRLPGYGDDGPTLEIFSYDQLIESGLSTPNRSGFGHIAFAVEDVDEALHDVIAAGGGAVGNIETTKVEDVGTLRVVYTRDPEGNIVELQKWS